MRDEPKYNVIVWKINGIHVFYRIWGVLWLYFHVNARFCWALDDGMEDAPFSRCTNII